MYITLPKNSYGRIERRSLRWNVVSVVTKGSPPEMEWMMLRTVEVGDKLDMESSVETTKPTDKPHSKLDVLSGKTRAGTQSPTKVFIRGKRKLKGPLAKLIQQRR